jgi:RES domain-containing protein
VEGWDELSGSFYRVVRLDEEERVLDGAASIEGRFHHRGQPALYMSPSVEAAGHAVARFVRDGDPSRRAFELTVSGASVVDLRNPLHCRALSIDPQDAAIDWMPQREAGEPANSWRPADAVRSAGADGMIYTARSHPARWHLVLFRWNAMGGPRILIARSFAWR